MDVKNNKVYIFKNVIFHEFSFPFKYPSITKLPPQAPPSTSLQQPLLLIPPSLTQLTDASRSRNLLISTPPLGYPHTFITFASSMTAQLATTPYIQPALPPPIQPPSVPIIHPMLTQSQTNSLKPRQILDFVHNMKSTDETTTYEEALNQPQ